MADTFRWDRPVRRNMGVRPRKAQVRRTRGAIKKPLSSIKTRFAFNLRAFF
jgi:hypothetical protein